MKAYDKIIKSESFKVVDANKNCILIYSEIVKFSVHQEWLWAMKYTYSTVY